MGDITSGCTFTKIAPALGFSKYELIVIETAATADTGDTITLAAAYGTIAAITGFDEDTAVAEAPTWVVATGVITLGGSGNSNKTRILEVLVKK
jgi:hypothetical protein